MAKRIIYLKIYEYDEDFPLEEGKDWEEQYYDPAFPDGITRLHRNPEIGPSCYFPKQGLNCYYLHGERLREEKC